MHRQSLNRLVSWQATLSNATARFRRPRVTAILCQHCRTWVKPRRFDPLVYACKACAPAVSYGYYQARRAAADTIEAQRRAWDKEMREWRRQARVTATR